MPLIRQDIDVLVKPLILKHSRLVEYARDEELFAAGAPQGSILTVSSGALGIFANAPPDIEPRLYTPVLRNSTIGVAQALFDYPAMRTTALAASHVYVLPKEAVAELWKEELFRDWTSSIMGRNVRLLAMHRAALLANLVRDRIINTLQVAYMQVNGTWPAKQFEVDWPIRRSDFAEILGVSRPYLQNALGKLEKSGNLVFTEKKAIVAG